MTNESFEKYSAASKARWAKRTPEVKKYMMSMCAKAKWASLSDEQKSAHIALMVSARKNKQNGTTKKEEGTTGCVTDVA